MHLKKIVYLIHYDHKIRCNTPPPKAYKCPFTGTGSFTYCVSPKKSPLSVKENGDCK